MWLGGRHETDPLPRPVVRSIPRLATRKAAAARARTAPITELASSRAADVSPVSQDPGGFRLLSEEVDALGMVHRRYQQLLNGLPVEGGGTIEHHRNGAIDSVSGAWLKPLPTGLQQRASFTQVRALANALAFVGASIYKWQLPEEEAFLQRETGNPAATFRPRGELLYHSSDKKNRHFAATGKWWCRHLRVGRCQHRVLCGLWGIRGDQGFQPNPRQSAAEGGRQLCLHDRGHGHLVVPW